MKNPQVLYKRLEGWVENNEGRFSLLTNATHARLAIVSKYFHMHDTKKISVPIYFSYIEQHKTCLVLHYIRCMCGSHFKSRLHF